MFMCRFMQPCRCEETFLEPTACFSKESSEGIEPAAENLTSACDAEYSVSDTLSVSVG